MVPIILRYLPVATSFTDDAGDGYTYYKLRDLGKYLGFHVDWPAETGVFVETNTPVRNSPR